LIAGSIELHSFRRHFAESFINFLAGTCPPFFWKYFSAGVGKNGFPPPISPRKSARSSHPATTRHNPRDAMILPCEICAHEKSIIAVAAVAFVHVNLFADKMPVEA
jgi:hypothetical protein